MAAVTYRINDVCRGVCGYSVAEYLLKLKSEIIVFFWYVVPLDVWSDLMNWRRSFSYSLSTSLIIYRSMQKLLPVLVL